MRIWVPALVGILSCVAVAVFGQNPDLAGTWKRTQTDSSAICKIEQTDASISFNLKTHFQAGELSGWSNGTETYTPDGVERETKADTGRQRWLTVYWQGRALVILRVVKDSYHVGHPGDLDDLGRRANAVQERARDRYGWGQGMCRSVHPTVRSGLSPGGASERIGSSRFIPPSRTGHPSCPRRERRESRRAGGWPSTLGR